MEIQSGLPPFVKLIKDPDTSFDKVLSSETAGSASDTGAVNFDYKNKTDFDAIIDEACRRYNISSNVIRAVVKAESGFNPKAVSDKGAVGLMQLMPDTAAGLGVKNPYDPVQNIDGGVRYLKSLLNEFGGDLELALAAYNSGAGNVKKYGGIPPFRETQDYVQKIMGYIRNKV